MTAVPPTSRTAAVPICGRAPMRGEKKAWMRVDLDALVEKPVDRTLEAAELVVLLGEGLDHADTGDVLLCLGGQFGHALLDFLHRRPGLAGEADRGQDHERGGSKGDERKPRVDHEHDRPGQYNGQQAL